jgi:hypothetical protein
MSSSRRFTQLAKRLKALRTHLLPQKFSPTGQYSVQQHDLARAYVVLVHAELEAYCEDRGTYIAQRAQEVWKKKGRHTSTLMQLLRFHHATARKPWTPIDKSPNKVEGAFKYYMATIIGQNHGIREENLSKIFFPIGIDLLKIDNVWLTTMDSFGAARGAVAHTSVKTQQPIDPETEFNRIDKQILPGLKKLDKKINRL